MSAKVLLCLEASYQEYTKTKGVAAPFAKLKAAYAAVSTVRVYCHPLAHAIGRTAGDMYKDVSDAFPKGIISVGPDTTTVSWNRLSAG